MNMKNNTMKSMKFLKKNWGNNVELENYEAILFAVFVIGNTIAWNLEQADFDSGVRRYLGALHGCQNGPSKSEEKIVPPKKHCFFDMLWEWRRKAGPGRA